MPIHTFALHVLVVVVLVWIPLGTLYLNIGLYSHSLAGAVHPMLSLNRLTFTFYIALY